MGNILGCWFPSHRPEEQEEQEEQTLYQAPIVTPTTPPIMAKQALVAQRFYQEIEARARQRV